MPISTTRMISSIFSLKELLFKTRQQVLQRVCIISFSQHICKNRDEENVTPMNKWQKENDLRNLVERNMVCKLREVSEESPRKQKELE